MTKRYIISESDVVSVEKTGELTKVCTVAGYAPNVDELLSLRDTGNGFVSLLNSYSIVEQDHYVCLDYAEAEYLYYAIGEALGLRKKKAKKVLPSGY
jgi:hypothetical protein